MSATAYDGMTPCTSSQHRRSSADNPFAPIRTDTGDFGWLQPPHQLRLWIRRHHPRKWLSVYAELAGVELSIGLEDQHRGVVQSPATEIIISNNNSNASDPVREEALRR
jgi:hypothetical protein